jgi:hypothetical protein
MDTNKSKLTTISFTFGPEWSLTKKSLIELVDSLNALEYLLNLLGVQVENQDMTPRNAGQLGSIRENSASKNGSLKKFKTLDQTVTKPLSSASRALFNSAKQKTPIHQKFSFVKNKTIDDFTEEEHDDDRASICSNESIKSNASIATIKSIASFHSEVPKMNSTVMSASNVNRTYNMRNSNATTSKK